jgi:RNA polymerase sigma factor for flagellar operon FliA
METTLESKVESAAPRWDERVRVFGSEQREAFVLAHAPLVRFIAQRILFRLPSSVELQDLVNEGVVGLIEAIERYDPGRGVRFGSFAEVRIRGAILDSLRARDVASRSLRRRLREMDSAAQRAEQRLGRAPGTEEVAEELGVESPYVSNLRRDRETTRSVSADPRLTESTEEAGIASPAPGPFDQLSQIEVQERLAEEIQALDPRDRTILGLYYEKELTLKEIGLVLGITESRVCQIHTRAVKDLRKKLRGHLEASKPREGKERGCPRS